MTRPGPTIKSNSPTLRRIPLRLGPFGKMARGVLLVTFIAWLTACEFPRQATFSSVAADSLLDDFVTVSKLGDLTVDDESCRFDQDEFSSVEVLAARYLTSELGLACSQRVLESRVEGTDAVSVFEHRDIVAWNYQRSWREGVHVALFFPGERREDDVLARTDLLPIATALEGLRTLHEEKKGFTKNIVVTISAVPSHTERHWLPPASDSLDTRRHCRRSPLRLPPLYHYSVAALAG